MKERAMEEEKKDKGEVGRGNEGGGGKKKVERLPTPGSPGNPFRCPQGLKCPWVNGEKGPRCRLWHPESSTGSLGKASMKASEEEKEDGMTGEKKEEKEMDNVSANASLLKNAPQIKKGADISTRKCFIDLLQEVRPARGTQMPKEHVVGKAKSTQRKFQPHPKGKECQHMQRVKSLKKGWVFGWEGTRDGKIYQLPEDSDTGFYKLFDPLRPIPENCHCMRLTPVKSASKPTPKGTRVPKTGAKKNTQTKPKKMVIGDSVVDSIQIDVRVLTGAVPHPKIYTSSHKPGNTSPDPVRTKAANQKKAAKEKMAKRAHKLKQESKERQRFLDQTERKKPKGANKQTPLPSKKKVQKGYKGKEKKSAIHPSPISEEVMKMVNIRIIELEEQVHECKEDKVELKNGESKKTKKLPRTRGGALGDAMSWPQSTDISDKIALLEARLETSKVIANIGIEVAATTPGHEISLYHPLPNNADGDCSIETTTDQLNNTRNSESNRDFANLGAGEFPEPIDLRRAVVQALMHNEIAIQKAGFAGREEEYKAQLRKLLDPKTWDTDLGDLIVPGIALVVRKNLLIYRTNTQHGDSPILVVSPTELGGVADTPIPIILCYTGFHFEGLVPSTATDVEKTVLLVQAYEEGRVNVTSDEIPVLRKQKEERSKGASKVGGHKRTYAEVSASIPSTSTSNIPSKKIPTMLRNCQFLQLLPKVT